MANPNSSSEELSCMAKVKEAPESQKQLIFDRACNAVRNRASVVTFALALGLSQPGFTQELGNQNKNVLSQYPDIQAISNMHRQAIENGKLPKTFPLDIVKVGGIKSLSDLEQIVTGGANLPKKSWQELSKGSDDFFVWLDILFDPKDIDSWLKMGKEKRSLTPEEKKAYIEELAKTKKRWQENISKWQVGVKNGELDPKIFDDADKFFKDGVKTITYPSRETFRRLLIASGSIAYFKNFKGNENVKKGMVSTTATQVGEYALLTNPNFSGTKVEFGNEIYSVKYILPDSKTISSNPNLAGLEGISTEALGYFKSGFKYNLESAGSKYNIVQGEQRIDQDKQYIEISTNIDNLTKEIVGLIDVYMRAKNPDIFKQIQEKMKIILSYLPIIQEKSKLGVNSERWKKELTYISNLEKKVNQLPKAKV